MLVRDGDELDRRGQERAGRAQRACRSAASRASSTPTSRPVVTDDADEHGDTAGPIRRDRMTLQSSPLDAAHRALGATMVPVRWLGHADRAIRPGTHRRAPGLPQRRGRGVRRVATSARSGSTGPDAYERAPVDADERSRQDRPGRAQYTHLLDDGDASVLDDIIVWWRPDDRERLRRDAERLEHRRCASRRIGGVDDDHASRAVIAVQGPRPRERCAARVPRGRRRRAVPGRRRRLGRRRRASSPAPATPARTASRSPSPPMPRRRCGTRCSAPASHRPVSAPATRCASRRRCRCTATNSGPGITSLQAGLGWVVAWDKPRFRRARRGARRT